MRRWILVVLVLAAGVAAGAGLALHATRPGNPRAATVPTSTPAVAPRPSPEDPSTLAARDSWQAAERALAGPGLPGTRDDRWRMLLQTLTAYLRSSGAWGLRADTMARALNGSGAGDMYAVQDWNTPLSRLRVVTVGTGPSSVRAADFDPRAVLQETPTEAGLLLIWQDGAGILRTQRLWWTGGAGRHGVLAASGALTFIRDLRDWRSVDGTWHMAISLGHVPADPGQVPLVGLALPPASHQWQVDDHLLPTGLFADRTWPTQSVAFADSAGTRVLVRAVGAAAGGGMPAQAKRLLIRSQNTILAQPWQVLANPSTTLAQVISGSPAAKCPAARYAALAASAGIAAQLCGIVWAHPAHLTVVDWVRAAEAGRPVSVTLRTDGGARGARKVALTLAPAHGSWVVSAVRADTLTPTPTHTPSVTPSFTPTARATVTPQRTGTPTPSETPAPGATPTPTQAPSAAEPVWVASLAPGYITTLAGNSATHVNSDGNTVGTFTGDGGPAAQAGLSVPYSVAVDPSGNLIIADTDNSRIRMVAANTGIITTIAGNGHYLYSGDNGPALDAGISPNNVTVDRFGNIYIADTGNYRIRKIAADSGIISTVAGSGNLGLSGDGIPGTEADLTYPNQVAVDAAGNLYIADFGAERVRMVAADTGLITTAAGNGTRTINSAGHISGSYSGDGGPATDAGLYHPSTVAIDPAGNLYIADTDNNRIRRVDARTGIITTVAGNGSSGFSGDGGPATAAALDHPWSVVLDGAGNLYVSDSQNNRIRRVDAVTGIITTVTGDGRVASNGDGVYGGDGGPATQASLNLPLGLAIDGAGNLYIADSGNNRVRVVRGIAVPTHNG